jgi:hypothetical protein
MVRTFQWGILERRTKTDFAVHAKMYSKLQKRAKPRAVLYLFWLTDVIPSTVDSTTAKVDELLLPLL